MSGHNDRQARVVSVRLSTPLTGRAQNTHPQPTFVIEKVRHVGS